MVFRTTSAALIAIAASALALSPVVAKPTAPASAPKSAISQDCSKQADAKGLHGKERERFRYACKKGGASGGSMGAATPGAAPSPKASRPARKAADAGAKPGAPQKPPAANIAKH